MKRTVTLLALAFVAFLTNAQPAEFSYTSTNTSGVLIAEITIDGVAAETSDWIAAFDAG